MVHTTRTRCDNAVTARSLPRPAGLKPSGSTRLLRAPAPPARQQSPLPQAPRSTRHPLTPTNPTAYSASTAASSR
jgi:hypothetical protein